MVLLMHFHREIRYCDSVSPIPDAPRRDGGLLPAGNVFLQLPDGYIYENATIWAVLKEIT